MRFFDRVDELAALEEQWAAPGARFALDVDRRAIATASCKWTNAPLDYGEEALLTRLESALPAVADAPRHYFYSRSGFTDRMRALAESEPRRIRLLEPEDLYR
jgi:hypothetical protein